MRILLMLSGGVDSVYLLTKFLKEKDFEVDALHIRMANREARWDVETAATRRIAEYCHRNFGAFNYHETTVDRRQLSDAGQDTHTFLIYAGMFIDRHWPVNNDVVNRITTGYCLEEQADIEGEEDDMDARFRRHLMLSKTARRWRDDVEYWQPELVSKVDELKYIGPELAALCWTCRFPEPVGSDKFKECGVCRTCQIMADSRIELPATFTPTAREFSV